MSILWKVKTMAFTPDGMITSFVGLFLSALTGWDLLGVSCVFLFRFLNLSNHQPHLFIICDAGSWSISVCCRFSSEAIRFSTQSVCSCLCLICYPCVCLSLPAAGLMYLHHLHCTCRANVLCFSRIPLLQLAGALLTACFIYLLYKEEEEDFSYVWLFCLRAGRNDGDGPRLEGILGWLSVHMFTLHPRLACARCSNCAIALSLQLTALHLDNIAIMGCYKWLVHAASASICMLSNACLAVKDVR